MSTYLPVGLTHLLPSSGVSVDIASTDIQSDSGKVGPLLLKLTNSSATDLAVVTYVNEFIPTPPAPPVTLDNINIYGMNFSVVGNVNVTIEPGISITITQVNSSDSNYFYVDGPGNPPSPPAAEFQILSFEIPGGVDNIIFKTTAIDPPSTYPGQRGNLVSSVYVSGTIPGGSPAPTPTLPTVGNPTKVVTISPMASEFIQIPSSSTGDTVLYGSGADVYVTPVQIIA